MTRALLVLWLVLPAALSAQARKLPPRKMDAPTIIQHDTVFGFPANALGLTFCDTRGEVRSWADISSPPDLLRRIMAHEAKHRVQAARYPNCKAWEDAAQHNNYLAAEMEAEAYCADVAVADSADRRDVQVGDLNRVWKQFGGRVPLPVIVGYFDRYCS